MSHEQEIRAQVAEAYTRAVEAPSPSCCGGVPKGVAAKIAGYDPTAVAKLPADAVESSFGCGNPVAFSEVQAGDIVLDLGSGAGIDLLLAADRVGPSGRVIGVDMTDAMIERARRNTAHLANIEIRKGIIEDLPVASGSVDWVISNCVINLSPQKEKVFAEIARVLKPGGRMLVSDIVVKDLPAWARENVAVYASCVGGAIAEESYLAGLRAAGLGDVQVRQRLVYTPDQVAALISADGGCCGAPVSEGELAAMTREALRTGEVASVSIFARKA